MFLQTELLGNVLFAVRLRNHTRTFRLVFPHLYLLICSGRFFILRMFVTSCATRDGLLNICRSSIHAQLHDNCNGSVCCYYCTHLILLFCNQSMFSKVALSEVYTTLSLVIRWRHKPNSANNRLSNHVQVTTCVIDRYSITPSFGSFCRTHSLSLVYRRPYI